MPPLGSVARLGVHLLFPNLGGRNFDVPCFSINVSGTSEGMQIQSYFEAGDLVPDEIVVDVLIKNISARS